MAPSCTCSTTKLSRTNTAGFIFRREREAYSLPDSRLRVDFYDISGFLNLTH